VSIGLVGMTSIFPGFPFRCGIQRLFASDGCHVILQVLGSGGGLSPRQSWYFVRASGLSHGASTRASSVCHTTTMCSAHVTPPSPGWPPGDRVIIAPLEKICSSLRRLPVAWLAYRTLELPEILASGASSSSPFLRRISVRRPIHDSAPTGVIPVYHATRTAFLGSGWGTWGRFPQTVSARS